MPHERLAPAPVSGQPGGASHVHCKRPPSPPAVTRGVHRKQGSLNLNVSLSLCHSGILRASAHRCVRPAPPLQGPREACRHAQPHGAGEGGSFQVCMHLPLQGLGLTATASTQGTASSQH